MDQDPLAPLLPDDRLTGDLSLSPPPPTEASDPFAVPEPGAVAAEPGSVAAEPGSVDAAHTSWMLGGAAGTPPTEAQPPTVGAYETPTIDPSPATASKASAPRRGIAAAAAAIAALLGVFAVKVIIGLLVAGAAASAIGAVFGGPWDHLPSDVKDRLNQRVEAALGDQANGLSDSDKSAKLYAMGDRGLSRLDDQTLIRRVELYKVALDGTDEATCAAIFRSSMTGPVADDDAKKLIGGLTTDQFGEWAEIWVRAVEAEAKDAPPVRTVSDADSNAMFDAMFAVVSDEDVATIKALSAGTTVTDADACQANRALYAAGLGLDDPKLAVFALTDVTP